MNERSWLPHCEVFCSLSPAAPHLTAHCGCSFLLHYTLQYLKLICCRKMAAVLLCRGIFVIRRSSQKCAAHSSICPATTAAWYYNLYKNNSDRETMMLTCSPWITCVPNRGGRSERDTDQLSRCLSRAQLHMF